MERPAFWRRPQDFNPRPAGKRCNPHVWQPNYGGKCSSATKVAFGSPASDAGLKSGDVIHTLASKSTVTPPMTHQQASDIIKRSGNTLNVTIQRGPNSGQSPPISPSLYMSHSPRPQSVGKIPYYEGHGHMLDERESAQYATEKTKERMAVVNQPYRTMPVVQPKPKSHHDYPVGSYLKYVQDPSWNEPPKPAPLPSQPDKLREVMQKMTCGVDPEKIVNLQYNSPINLYSNENVAHQLMPQVSPGRHQAAQAPVKGQRGVPPLVRPFDLTASPTYQLVQEQEQGKNHEAVKDRLYTISTTPTNEEPPVTVHYHDPHHFPLQSRTFNTLMSSLLQHPKC